MAYINVTIYVPQFSIQTVNDKVISNSESLNNLQDVIAGVSGGVFPGSVKITSLVEDPGVTVDADPKSTQKTVNKL